SHGRDAILADAQGLAIRLVAARRTIHQLEHSASASGDARKRSRSQSALGGDGEHALVDLNRSEAAIQRVALGSHGGELFVPFGPGGPEPVLYALAHFTALELLRFLQALLLLDQLADLVRVDAIETFLLLRELVAERDVVGAEVIQLGFVHRTIHIQHPGAIALDVERLLVSRNF